MSEPEILRDPVFREHIVSDGEKHKLAVDIDGFKQVDLRDPYPFEDDLLDRITQPTHIRGGTGASIPIKGLWIHDWLDFKGRDYINNIYNNWLYFTMYVRVRTRQFINTSEFKIRQGSYKNMHRYIVILEDLGLVERGMMEQVDQDEYDHFVPDEMRNRRFVTVITPFEEAEEKWTRPHKSLYGDIDTEDLDEEEPEVIEPELPPEERSLDDFRPDDPEIPEEDTVQEEPAPVDLDTDGDIAITNYPRYEELIGTIQDQFNQTIEQSLSDTNIPVDLFPEDFNLDGIGVLGIWATDEAQPEVDNLELLISIEAEDSELKPGFVPSSLARRYQSMLTEEFSDWFPMVDVTGTYRPNFKEITRMAASSSDTDVYYNVFEDEVIDPWE